MNYEELVTQFGKLLAQVQQGLLDFLPNLIGALTILLIGFLLARLLQSVISRFVKNLDRLVPNKRIQRILKRVAMEQEVSKVIGSIFYWIIIFFFLTVATEVLGLPVVTTWLGGIVSYLPRILAAALIGFAGIVGGVLLRDAIFTAATSAGIAYGGTLGRLAQLTILLITALVGLDQLGINITFLTSFLIITAAAILFGAGLAFGLGAQTSISNILAAYYLQKTYTVGHTISIGGMKGPIIEFTPTAVILDAPEGRVLVPAKAFSEITSILLTKESPLTEQK